MIIRAVGNKVLVEKDPAKSTMEGGILIPERAERTPRFSPTVKGTVLSAGASCTIVKKGDRVALKAIAGDDYYVEGRQLTILREKDLVGVIE